jgi:hypothetical protein
MNLPLDPQADPSRRAWIHCTICPPQTCDDCAGRRNCSVHYSYLLGNHGHHVSLQCQQGHVWTVDTRKRNSQEAKA